MASSAAQQPMLPLTFGIEIEFLFGIDNAKAAANPAYEDILRNNIILDNDQVDEIYDTEFDNASDLNAEGLFQAASALRRKGANLRIRFASKAGGLEDFSRWVLTQEEAVEFPTSSAELSAYTNGRNPVTSPLHNCGEGPEFSAQDEFVKIFNYDHGSERMDRARLCGILCSRTGYDITPHSKKTVEFRQHHGTLSVEEVNQWVFFVTALVRAAERKMNQESVEVPLPYDFIPKVIEKQGDYSKQILTFQQAWKYPEILWNKKRSLKELFDLLDMPLERRMWWWQKASYFRSNAFKEYRYLSTCAAPCDNPPRRDCDGWDGEGIPRPY
ncbi:hypothetical protein KCU88_g2904, partial [Aureobasidium melanogenum]